MKEKKASERSLKEIVVEILKDHGYRVGYTAYHSDADVKEFSEQEKNMDTNKYFTIFNEGGYVVCRMNSVRERTKLLKEDVKEICEVFRMFEIANRDLIIKNLENI